MLIFFWSYAGIPGVAGLSPLGQEGEEVIFEVSAFVGWFNSITFTLFLIIELALIKPAYDKLVWNTFQEIGSDVHIQTCYQNFEVAKGSWVMLIFFGTIEIAGVMFFEDSNVRLVVFGIASMVYIGALIVGAIAVRKLISIVFFRKMEIWLVLDKEWAQKESPADLDGGAGFHHHCVYVS